MSIPLTSIPSSHTHSSSSLHHRDHHQLPNPKSTTKPQYRRPPPSSCHQSSPVFVQAGASRFRPPISLARSLCLCTKGGLGMRNDDKGGYMVMFSCDRVNVMVMDEFGMSRVVLIIMNGCDYVCLCVFMHDYASYASFMFNYGTNVREHKFIDNSIYQGYVH
ncbi:hypothetical protein Droror1_Dr00011093 [Drosera rotundifolia]